MPRVARDTTHHPWGALAWNRAPCKRFGWAGKCAHCGRNALLYHPVTGKPCHKVCQDRMDAGQWNA